MSRGRRRCSRGRLGTPGAMPGPGFNGENVLLRARFIAKGPRRPGLGAPSRRRLPPGCPGKGREGVREVHSK